MNRERAEITAASFNRLPHIPQVSYMAYAMQPTKWEKDRWGVVQFYEGNLVGIAAT